jgi:hypothetical protein
MNDAAMALSFVGRERAVQIMEFSAARDVELGLRAQDNLPVRVSARRELMCLLHFCHR